MDLTPGPAEDQERQRQEEPVCLADLFAEEPPDGTRLVIWHGDSHDGIVIKRDDERSARAAESPEACWWGVDYIPLTFREALADATMVHAVMPLERSGLALVDKGDWR